MRTLWRALLGISGLWLAASACAAPPLLIFTGGVDKHIYLPARLADKLGYFEEQGVPVRLASEPSGVHAEDVLLVGAAQGVIGAYDHTLDLQARGKAVQAVALLTLSPGEVELVSTRLAPVIRSPAQFKGRRLGVTGLGSSTHFLTQYLASLHELKPADYRVLPVGSGDSFVNAMRQGRIDAGMTTEPTASRLISAGEAQVLVDLRTPDAVRQALGGVYPFACLYLQTAWVNSHRQEVQGLVNALVKALRFIQTHSAEDIVAQLGLADEAQARAAYVQSLKDSKSMFSPDGFMPEAGPPMVLKVMSAVNRSVREKNIDLGKTYTSEFVRHAASLP